jgi:FMN phosphatase YigB (HAD superfamily)
VASLKALKAACIPMHARTFFIDDSVDNVATADQLSFTTIYFNEGLPTCALNFCAWACQQKLLREKRI